MDKLDSTVRTLQFHKFESEHSRFLARPVSNQDCANLLSAEIWNARTRWSATLKDSGFSFPIALLCHLQTGGPICYIQPYSGCSSDEKTCFIRHHKDCCKENTVMLLKLPRSKVNGSSSNGTEIDYCVAPFWGNDPQHGKSPIFAVYATGRLPLDFLLVKVLQPRRLPVIFDLDETLVKARSLSHLSNESIHATIESRRTSLLGAINPGSSTEAEVASIHRQINAEASMLQQDATSLRYYRDNDTILLKNGNVPPQYIKCPFYAQLPTGELSHQLSWVTRPIVKTQEDLVFTRIQPGVRETSMVFRIRPYWSEVRTLLTGGADRNGVNSVGNRNAKPLIEAFVCTTAEHEYAHEAWRVLDVGEALIPHTIWPKRILSRVTRQKSLSQTLLLNDPLYSEDRSVMPFAVILDDNLAIWESKVQKQVIQVSKWEPYQEWGRVITTGKPWEKAPAGLEMLKIGSVLRDLQKEMFQKIDNQKSILQKRTLGQNIAILDLMKVDASYAASFAPPPWTAQLLPRILKNATPLPLPARAHAMIRAREEKEKAAKVQKEKEQALQALKAGPPDPRIAARAAAAAAAAAIAAAKKQEEEEQQLAEPAEFNLETDAAIFKNWGKQVQLPAPAPQQEQEEEASKNKRKRQDAIEDLVEADEDMEGSPSLEDKSPSDSDSDDDLLKERDSVARSDLNGHEKEAKGSARKKAHIASDHPIILLSIEAQAQSKHLMYTVESQATGGYFAKIEADGQRIGFSPGSTEEEARRNASIAALERLQKGSDASGSGVPSTLAATAAALVGTGAPGIGGQQEIIKFNQALDKLKELFPETTNGQKVVFKQEGSQPGISRYRCTVRRDFDSDEEEYVAFGEGIGERGYFQAKREAAAAILRQLGYQVTEFVPI